MQTVISLHLGDGAGSHGQDVLHSGNHSGLGHPAYVSGIGYVGILVEGVLCGQSGEVTAVVEHVDEAVRKLTGIEGQKDMTYVRGVGHVLDVVDTYCIEGVLFLEDGHNAGSAAECKLVHFGELALEFTLLEVVILKRGI